MASKGNQEHSVSIKGNPGRSNLMVLIELKLGCSQRLLRRASSASARRPGTDASTRTSIITAISQQVEAQLATLERQREERDVQVSVVAS